MLWTWNTEGTIWTPSAPLVAGDPLTPVTTVPVPLSPMDC